MLHLHLHTLSPPLSMPFGLVNCLPKLRTPTESSRMPSSLCCEPDIRTTAHRTYSPSIYSNDSGTLLTPPSNFNLKDIKIREESPPRYTGEKQNLPYTQYFEKGKQRISEEYNPYSMENMEQGSHHCGSCHSSSNTRLLRTGYQLASALGPDNILQTTEIDSIPCAGVRIPHGPLRGLLAWRLVVRIPGTGKQKAEWWEDTEHWVTMRRRRGTSLKAFPPLPNKPVHSHSYSGCSYRRDDFPSVARRSHPQLLDTLQTARRPIVLVSNFILDTSLPHSLISRNTLLALGYPPSHLPRTSTADCGGGPSVTLSIQGVSTRLHIANDGEASRLGVQFLHDAGISICFPRNGDGVGPVLYRMITI